MLLSVTAAVAFTTFIPLRRATALSSSKKDRANNKEARQLATLAIQTAVRTRLEPVARARTPAPRLLREMSSLRLELAGRTPRSRRAHLQSRPWESSLATPERGHGDVSLLLLDAG